MERHLLVVLTNPVEGKEEEYNDWYSNTHLDDVLKTKGFVAAQRFRLAKVRLGGMESPYRYLALYEIETDNLDEAIKELINGAGEDMYITDALDQEDLGAWVFSPITEKVRAREAEEAWYAPRGIILSLSSA